MATDLVSGSLFTPLGRRSVRVFDHVHGGQVSSVVVALQRRVHAGDLVAELWLDQPLSQDTALDMLGPVGDRVAFVSDPDGVRRLMTPELALALNALGADVPVAWFEQDWVLAATPFTATPTRLERLLRALDEIADLLDSDDDRGPDLSELADSVEPIDPSGSRHW